MNRRHLLLSPAAAALLSAQQQTNDEAVSLTLTAPDAPAEAVRRFFTPEQFGTLAALAEVLAPSVDGRPGAKEAEAAAFLDFLIAKSPRDRQLLYQRGLTQLEREARAKYQKSFAALKPAEAGVLLAPLAAKWTYNAPVDPQAAFLRAAKSDVIRATTNSRAVAEANAAARRRTSGLNPYWSVID